MPRVLLLIFAGIIASTSLLTVVRAPDYVWTWKLAILAGEFGHWLVLLLTAKSLKNRTLHNDRPVDGPVLIQAGDRIRLGVTGPTVLILAIETIELFGGHRAAVGESEAVAVSRRRWRARSAALLAAGLILLVAGVLLCLVLRTCSTR